MKYKKKKRKYEMERETGKMKTKEDRVQKA